MTELIRRPAGNVVLEFKETDSYMKRTITLTSTDEEGVFEMERGLTALNQIIDKRIVRGADEVRAIWVDAVVNGFKMTKNEVFMRGVKDALKIPPGTKFSVQPEFINTPAPHLESTMEIAIPADQMEIRGGCAPEGSSIIVNASNP
tara:strand:+ start:469 stop:906 length:438 start_codon:yes stop_codon:yes gene_type:complete